VNQPRVRVLLASLHDASSPGPRYRLLQFAPYLEAAGVQYTFLAMQSPASTRRSVQSVLLPRAWRTLHNIVVWMQTLGFQLRIVFTSRHFDRIVLHRVPISGWARWLLRGRRRDIITDFDDALDVVPEDRREFLGGLNRRLLRRGLENAIRASILSITSNANNRDIVERLHGRAAVIPTCIDLARLPLRDRRAPVESRLVIGWIGTPSTALYLQSIEEALLTIARAHDVAIRLVGAGRSPFRTLPAEVHEWSFDREPEELRRFDVGLMPMPDTPWTRGKAALKALQYGASGAPTVASYTPTNVAMLGENDGTLFARTPEDWVRHLGQLLEDAAARADLGRRARARVERFYSVEGNAPLLVRLIRDPQGPTS